MPRVHNYFKAFYELAYVLRGYSRSVKAGRKGQEIFLIPVLPRGMKVQDLPKAGGIIDDRAGIEQLGRRFEKYFAKISYGKTTFATTATDWVNVSLPFRYYLGAKPETVAIRKATLRHYLLTRRLCLDPQGNVLVPNGKKGIHRYIFFNGRLVRGADEIPERPENPIYIAVAQHPDGHLMAISDRGIYYRKPPQDGGAAREYTFGTNYVATDVFLRSVKNRFYVSSGEHGVRGYSHSGAHNSSYEDLSEIPNLQSAYFNNFLYMVDGENLRCANLDGDVRRRDGVSRIPVGKDVRLICAINGFLFVASHIGIHVFNAGRPVGANQQSPPLMGVVPLPDGGAPVTAFAAFGDVLLVGTKAGGIHALDTGSIAAPDAWRMTPIVSAPPTGRSVVLALLVSGSRVYSLELGVGLRTFVLGQGQRLGLSDNAIAPVPFVSDRGPESWFASLAGAEAFYDEAFQYAKRDDDLFLSPKMQSLYSAQAMENSKDWLKRNGARIKSPENYSAIGFFVAGPWPIISQSSTDMAVELVDPVWGINVKSKGGMPSAHVAPNTTNFPAFVHEIGHRLVPFRPDICKKIGHVDVIPESNKSGLFDIMGIAAEEAYSKRAPSLLGPHLFALDFIDSTARIDERTGRTRVYHLTQKEPWENTRPFPSANIIFIPEKIPHFIELRAPQLPPPAVGSDPTTFETAVPEEISPSRVGAIISRSVTIDGTGGIQLHSEGDRDERGEVQPVILMPPEASDPTRPWIRSSVDLSQTGRRITVVGQTTSNPWTYEVYIEDIPYR